MIKKMKLPDEDLHGFEIQGKITKEEYIHTLKGLFEQLRRNGRKERFLFYFGPEFLGFTAGAVWADFKLGIRHLRTIERCAVVSDLRWVQNTANFVGSILPVPVYVYKNKELSEAIAWLSSGEIGLEHYLDEQSGVLTVEIYGPLTSENFEIMAQSVDSWVEKRGELRGLVLHVKEFPGWENLGSFLSHLEFVKEHHRKIRRVAFAADGVVPNIMSKLAMQFMDAEIKTYKYDQLRRAQGWAGERIKYTVDEAASH